MKKDYLTSKDVAAALDVSQITVSRWRKKGYGPAWLKIGGVFRYPRAEFEAWMAEHMTVAA